MSVCASSLSFIDGSVLNVALPAMRESLDASAAQIQWVVNGFTLPLAALILLGGALGDHQGRRRWLVIGTILFGLASVLCAVSRSLELLLVGRALQGVAAALLLPNSLALLNSAYEGEARGRAVGIWAAAGAISAAIAPLIGGWLVDHVGWPSIFYINIPFAAASVAVALWKVPESKDRQKVPIDFPGAVLATLGLGALAYGLTLWSSHRSFSPLVGASIAAGIVILVVFMLIERRAGEKAMIPLRYFGDWCFSSLNLTTFLLYGTFGSCLLLLPYVLISAGGYSPVAAGMSLLPLSILMGLGSPLMGKLATRFGPRVPLTVGPLVVAAGFLLATRVASDQVYWTNVFPAVTLIALGMSILVAPLTSTVLVSVDPKHTGMVSGFNSALSRAGGLFGVSLLGAVLAENGKALLAPYSVAMIIGAVIAALSGLVSFIGLRHTSTSKQRKAAPT
ncbi:MFS transporter [Sphingomonas sp. RG327]|uniref:MFS transporter n=1 Tax=Sphingomonas anseongensis TaxID=2908207 RepID=A0ABT0RDI5_9SPHN|nr:MFS transporter [Sphingomonas anseongensis]MCL6678330.1 MFS transporter [Sphingomonas anseongensis]